ncbi:MAG: hypothetical protein J6Y41_04025 [Bacteroidaceae bacterium]|nr:hypothetical protein [Bacteroidaceae bacterium]
MKRIIIWATALVLICGTGLLTACSSEDNPSEPSEAKINRELLAQHFRDDALVLKENLSFEAIDMSSQAIEQLLKLMNKSRYFKEDMKKMMVLLTIQNLADKRNLHGVRVVFDEMGNYKASPATGMVFIFPATIKGYPKTLYKLSFASNRNWNDIPEKLDIILSCMNDGKEVVLCKSVSGIKMYSDYPGLAAMALGTFGFESKVEYIPLGADDGNGTSAIDIAASRKEDGSLDFRFGYVQNNLNILDVSTSLPLPRNYVISTVAGVIEGADNFTVNASILDDLYLTGNVGNGMSFMSALRDVMDHSGDKEQSQEQYNEFFKQLNRYISMYIACGKNGKAIPMQFAGESDGESFFFLPTFALDSSSDFTPLREIVDQATYESIVDAVRKTALPVSTSSTAYTDLLTMLMQILPIGVSN